MPNNDVQPWTPDPDTAPGTPPVNGTGGERGTSSFRGNAHFTHYGVRKSGDGFMGPKRGVDYHSDGVAVATVADGGREEAGSHAADPDTVAVTADNDAPVHGTAVLLTATVTPSADYKATGLVTFKDGGTTLGTHTLVAGDNNVATFNVSGGFTAGAHSITAVYAGDANYATATSPAHTVTAS